jgi:hypothetical protein
MRAAVAAAANDLMCGRLLLDEDVAVIVKRAQDTPIGR